MDNRDTCSLKDKKKMDANTVWQWRIMRVKKYSKHPEPFHYSNKIGLDFNVASKTHKKLDLQLATNGVILEVCDFAKVVNKSKRHFFTNILENNFNLGLENREQRIDFTSRILHKVKDLIRKPPKDKHDIFTLFDTSSKPEGNSNKELDKASTECKTESFQVEMDDTDDSDNEDEFFCSQAASKEYIKTESLSDEMDEAHVDSDNEDEFKCSQATSKEYIKTEILPDEMDGAHADDSENDELKSAGTQSAVEPKEDIPPPSFPYCEEIGLNFDFGSKQSLDPDVLTKGAVLELVHFTRVLTASYSPVVLDVLEHNFELDLKSQRVKNRVWFKISHLLKRRKRLITTGSKITPEFKNEPFSFKTNPFKRPRESALSNMGTKQYQFKEVTKRRQCDLKNKQEKRALLTTKEQVTKRHSRGESKNMDTNTFSLHADLCTSGPAEVYTCPLTESDLDSDKVTRSGNPGNGWDCSPLASQSDERGLCGGEEQKQSPRNAPNECDIEQEEMGTENNMWKLRANRVKQILFTSKKEFGSFTRIKKLGLEFNVGFGPKQNISVDSLTNSVLLELAKFALAINSSQQDFIMEILEYNFDLGLQSQYYRNLFTCEIMNRLSQLRSCEDAVKYSNEAFKLPGPMPSINMANQSLDCVSPELNSVLRMKECVVALVRLPHSQAETTEHVSQKSVDPYPFCKKISLKLHVSNRQPNKKLSINKLTNGAMTEATDFAEKLCGTFEQICLDILAHNFDLDLQNGDSEPARTILAQISAAMAQKNQSTCGKTWKKIKSTRKDSSTVKLDYQTNHRLDAYSAGSSQAAIIDQNVASFPDTEHQDELNLTLWKLRANHIQHILSIPHEEHCPLYSYSRCKKLGIDFNVGSGVKQNLDPKLLTNGVMVELNTFAKALLSTPKYFITEILEYNFNLDLKNEQDRSAFAQETLRRIRAAHAYTRNTTRRMKLPFELPDMRCIQEPTFDKTIYCPKCYQERNRKLSQAESDPGDMTHYRPHTVTDTVSADANCTAPKPAKDPSSTFSTTEEEIMDGYPGCKKIGLNLCVDKDQPKEKLDTQVLTRGIMSEVTSFAKKLCGTRLKIINDLLEHNFNIELQSRGINPASTFYTLMIQSDGGLFWLNKVFDIQSVPHTQPGHVRKEAPALQTSERMETIKKRKLALQAKEERATLPSCNINKFKSKTNHQSKVSPFPICAEIGLDLDVTSKSGEKEKLDLKLLTRAVVVEIHKFIIKKVGHYLPGTLFDILDYNFDLSSQHYRRWEFSLATAFEVNAMVNRYRKKPDGADEIFQLPFVFNRKASNRFAQQTQNKRAANSSLDMASKSESSCVDIRAPLLTSSDVSSSSQTVNSNVNPPFASQSDERGLCGDEEQTWSDMDQEEIGTENNYTCPLGESDLDSDEDTDSGNAGNQSNLQTPKSCSMSSDVLRESESSCHGICAPLLTSTNVSSSLPIVNPNVMSPLASQPDERGLCGGEEQKESPRNAPNECDLDQEEMGTEDNMWKLRANRVKQILFTLNKEFCSFTRIKKLGLEFNVGFGPKQNISVDSLTNHVLPELAKFALAINSSQQDFIMEILEYNFDLGLQSQYYRNLFTCETMNRVSQLRSCEDAVKYSNEAFKLPSPMPSINMANQSLDCANPELNSILRMKECVVAPVCVPHSQAETTEHVSQKSVDPYPFCKKIGLKLHVSNRQPNKKLNINKLTNGAMIEVTDFAEKLCGTYEQICLDILAHNFDLDLQSGDSESARNILAQMSAAMEQKNLSTCARTSAKVKGTRNGYNPSLDAGSAGSSQHTQHENDLNLKLWKLRANHIQHILSLSHEEHCPLYSYSRCKKLGIDFNVGSGVQQNLDPKLLTNGIMVELYTFVTAMRSATKYFVNEILEYNFNLDLKNEQDCSAFAQQTMTKNSPVNAQNIISGSRVKLPFELPDLRCIQGPAYDKTTYCPKCYQERNHKLSQAESDPGDMNRPRPHTMIDTVSADANCTAQKPTKDPSSTFSTTEEEIMDGYPHCRKIGLNLCVDKDQPKEKLDMQVLTHKIMSEVTSFAKTLCGTRLKIINDLLEHNFNIDPQSRVGNSYTSLLSSMPINDGWLTWFDDVFVIQPSSHKRLGPASILKEALAVQRSERMETIKKRKQALQAKEERATLQNVVKPKTNDRSRVNRYPICTEIGLDLDLTSKSNNKVKLDLNQLTRAVVFEIHAFAFKKQKHCFPSTVFDILQYNFDLSSHCYKRWEFSVATASKFNAMVNKCRKKLDRPDEVFQLPFVVDPKASKRLEKKTQNEKSATTSTDVSSSLQTVNPLFASQPDDRGLCGGEEQTQTTRNALYICDVEQEEMAAEYNYTCPLGESDLDSDEETDIGSTGNQNHLQNPEGCSLISDIPRESEPSCHGICAPLLTSTNVSSSLQTVNSSVNPILASQPDERGLCGDEEQTQTQRNVPNKGDMDQEEIGTENNYTCPLGKSDLDSDEYTDSGNAGNKPKRCSMSSDVLRESEQSCHGICAPLLTSTNVSSSLPTLNSSVNPILASQPDERGLCGGEEQKESPRNAPNEYDLDQEEIGTENNMWKLRANRVKRILFTSKKEFDSFTRIKKLGLEFNVGFGPKQNISVDSLTNPVLHELANFALAINSSQQDFIMEILEYNFDLGLQRQHFKNVFMCEILNKVSQLRSCEDAVKYSNEAFKPPVSMPSINMANQSVGRANPELNSVLRMKECVVALVRLPHSQAETTEHVSQKSVDPYPFCKKIGLKLHVSNRQPNKKVNINKLTSGVMIEVINFAEKLCGKFEQICLDILAHNFDLDLQNGDSESARNILAQISAAMEQKNQSTCGKTSAKVKGTRKDSSTVKLDCQNNPSSDACSAGSSQTANIDQNVASSPDTEHQDELNLTLWKLRAYHIQHILSIPHEEHCPLYSYSRCKKLGIDFNVGSGVQQNLDPKLLTNGLMGELSIFATALQSATKYFITDILEYNFHLNLKNERDRMTFALQTLYKIKAAGAYKKINTGQRMKIPFELPDTRCLPEMTFGTNTLCPKCYQERNRKLFQAESDPGDMTHYRPHTVTDTVSADANCTAPKPAKDPSSTFSTTEEEIMDDYPRCRKIGLNLFVDKDQPKEKLDAQVLTRGIMSEVTSFAKKLCGTRLKIINDLLEHNFNIDLQSRGINPASTFYNLMVYNDGGLFWLNKVFDIQSVPHTQPGHERKRKWAPAMQTSGRMKTIKKRKLALQVKEERATLPSHNMSSTNSKTNHQSKGNRYPICTEIGLDLDVTSKSGEKEKLDLKLLTRAVVFEIHTFIHKQVFRTMKNGHYFPGILFDILDYNFDLSSQHYRRWEFSLGVASKVNVMVKTFRKTRAKADTVFKLPFEFPDKASKRVAEKYSKRKKCPREVPDKKTNEGCCVHQVRYHSDVSRVHFLHGVKTNEDLWFHDEDITPSTDPWKTGQTNGLVSVGCGSPHRGNLQLKEEEYDPHYGDMEPDPDTEEQYHPRYDDVKMESNIEDVEHWAPAEPSGSRGYSLLTTRPNSENEAIQYYILAQPQGSGGQAVPAIYPNTGVVTYFIPVAAAALPGSSTINIGQGNDNTLIKGEQENVPVVSNTESEVDTKHERHP